MELVLLQDWLDNPENQPKEEMYWHNSFWRQVTFVRVHLRGLIFNSYEHGDQYPVQVIGTHRSKSIELPVYYINPHKGIEFVMRDNFHDWNVSVRSERPIPDIFHDLFSKHEKGYCYFQGFPADWRFGTYNSDRKEFSFCVDGDYQIWTFFFLIRAWQKKEAGR